MMDRKESYITLTHLGVSSIFICGFACCASLSLPNPSSQYFGCISIAAALAAIWDARIPAWGRAFRKGWFIYRQIEDPDPAAKDPE